MTNLLHLKKLEHLPLCDITQLVKRDIHMTIICGSRKIRIKNTSPIGDLFFLTYMNWLHKREVLHFSDWLVLEESKKAFSEAKSTRRRHPMFEHLDEVPVRHHGFIISFFKHFLLFFESSSLIERII